MLLTVQDIPDIGKGSNNTNTLTKQHHTLTKKSTLALSQQQQQQPQHQHHNHQHHHHHQYHQYNTDTVKRSHTSSFTSREADNNSIITTASSLTSNNNNNNNNNNKADKDYYDTSSTTTTITPPPSESGRETPLINNTNNNNNNNINTINNHQRDKREYHHTTLEHQHQRNDQQQQQQSRNREVVMDLQNQSYAYPQQLRSDIVYVTSEDEEAIPYHAREDSRPFTYGNPSGVQLSPNGTGMLKMQSGLSSPSLVRKTLGGTSPPGGGSASNTGKKVQIRNDFEEMLMQRREKILNDKYSIGDKTPNGGANNNSYSTISESRWTTNNYTNPTNGYHYHAPLKRSNTMDGGFVRSYSTDG